MYPACLLLQNTCLFWNQSSPQNIDKIRFTFETVVFSRWFFWFKIRRNCTAISSKEDFFFFNSKALSMYYILITVVCITYHSGLGMLLSFGDIGINIESWHSRELCCCWGRLIWPQWSGWVQSTVYKRKGRWPQCWETWVLTLFPSVTNLGKSHVSSASVSPSVKQDCARWSLKSF